MRAPHCRAVLAVMPAVAWGHAPAPRLLPSSDRAYGDGARRHGAWTTPQRGSPTHAVALVAAHSRGDGRRRGGCVLMGAVAPHGSGHLRRNQRARRTRSRCAYRKLQALARRTRNLVRPVGRRPRTVGSPARRGKWELVIRRASHQRRRIPHRAWQLRPASDEPRRPGGVRLCQHAFDARHRLAARVARVSPWPPQRVDGAGPQRSSTAQREPRWRDGD